jgi:hypothetical protein
MNQINVIRPYLYEGIWVFDDPSKELNKEALVGGMPEIIELACDKLNIRNPKDGFVAVFSKDPFPGAVVKLKWVEKAMGGNVYEWEGYDMEGWLCPALLKYFDEPPKAIHIQLKEKAS